jgi:hypothetical protein
MPSSPPFCICFHALAFLIPLCRLLRCGGYLLRFVATTCSCNVRSASALLFPSIPSVLKLVASASACASTPCPCLCSAISSAPCCVARVCPLLCCCEVIIMFALCPRPPPSHTVSLQACCVGLLATAPPSRPASTRRDVLKVGSCTSVNFPQSQLKRNIVCYLCYIGASFEMRHHIAHMRSPCMRFTISQRLCFTQPRARVMRGVSQRAPDLVLHYITALHLCCDAG